MSNRVTTLSSFFTNEPLSAPHEYTKVLHNCMVRRRNEGRKRAMVWVPANDSSEIPANVGFHTRTILQALSALQNSSPPLRTASYNPPTSHPGEREFLIESSSCRVAHSSHLISYMIFRKSVSMPSHTIPLSQYRIRNETHRTHQSGHCL